MKKLSTKRKWYLDRHCRLEDFASRRVRGRTLRPAFETRDPGVWRAPETFELVDESRRSILLRSLRHLRQLLTNAEHPVCLDFSNTKKMHAEGALLFLAELRRLIKHSQNLPSLACTPPASSKISQVLQQIGVFDLLGTTPGQRPVDDDVVNWRFAHGSKVEGSRYEDILAEYDGDIALELQQSLFTGISEAMTNVVNHAYEAGRSDGLNFFKSQEWWMFSQAKDHQLTVAFLDLGAGIPRTLPIKRPSVWNRLIRHGRFDDATAIDHAIRDSISRTGLQHRGKGLSQISKTLDSTSQGKVAIFSNSGAWTKHGTQSKKKNYRDSILGTLIYWILPLPRQEST